MDYSSFIVGLAIPIVILILQFFLPNAVVKKHGKVWGKFLTTFFRQKIGRGWEEVERYWQGTISAFMAGLFEGLDFDDQT